MKYFMPRLRFTNQVNEGACRGGNLASDGCYSGNVGSPCKDGSLGTY